MSDQNYIVTAEQLYFARETKPILKGVNLNIPRGKITAIMGPSGTGKTTLLRLIGGQLKPHAGVIKVNDVDISKLNHKKL